MAKFQETKHTKYSIINEQSYYGSDSDSVNNNSLVMSPAKTYLCCPPRRFYVAIAVMFGIAMVYLMRSNLSVAIEPMACQFNWSSTQQGWILSSFFIGYLPGNIPGSYLAAKYGGKNILLISVLSTSILTLLIPYSASLKFEYNHHLNCKCNSLIANNWCFNHGFYTNNVNQCNSKSDICDDKSYIYLIVILRILMGLFESVSFPALYEIIQTWSNKNERSTLIAIAMSGGVLGTIISFPLSTLLISSLYGWYSVFYLFSFIGLIWCLLFHVTVYENPQNDRYISEYEKMLYCEKHMQCQSEMAKNASNIDWKYFFINKTAISLYTVALCYNWSGSLLFSQVPTYLNDELNYDLTTSGIIAMLPYIASFLFTHLSAYLVDFLIYKNIFKRNHMRKIVQINAVISGILLVLCGYVENVTIVVMLLTLSSGVVAIANTGFYAVYIDISPTLSNVLYGVSNTFANIPGIIAPVSAGYIRDNIHDSILAWKIIFFIAFGVGTIGTIIYVALIDAEPIAELNIHKSNNINPSRVVDPRES